jgi:hypothetical protein
MGKRSALHTGRVEGLALGFAALLSALLAFLAFRFARLAGEDHPGLRRLLDVVLASARARVGVLRASAVRFEVGLHADLALVDLGLAGVFAILVYAVLIHQAVALGAVGALFQRLAVARIIRSNPKQERQRK